MDKINWRSLDGRVVKRGESPGVQKSIGYEEGSELGRGCEQSSLQRASLCPGTKGKEDSTPMHSNRQMDLK